MINATDLRVDDNPEPLGVDKCMPVFSWIPVSPERSRSQKAYRILVASSAAKIKKRQADIWDSGLVESGQTLYIPYAGAQLESACEYWWSVQLWDNENAPSRWTAPGRFGTGLLEPGDWKAAWIGRGPVKEPRLSFDENYANGYEAVERIHGVIPIDGSSTLLRYEFAIAKPVRRAVVFVSGLGFYHLSINGRRADGHAHSPSKTDYRKQVLYDAFDVAAILVPGPNAIGLMLGNGWYNPARKYWKWQMQWHGSKRAILQLHIAYEDGTRQIVTSDDRWKTSSGPVLEHCLYDGECRDARLEQPGWDSPGFDDSGWLRANLVEPPGGVLRFHNVEPIAFTGTIRPKAMWEPMHGVFLFDMGQNFSGVVSIRVQGPRGTRIQLRHAENIDGAGRLDPATNLKALNTDVFILKGEGVEAFEPCFTYHGFQYVEVTGWPGFPSPDEVSGRVMHTACRQSGEFRSSLDLVNRIHECTVWSQRSNTMGLPTDDNQRDERLGWMADGHLAAEQCLCNFDAVRLYRKWLNDMKAAQKPDGDVTFIVPWGGFDSPGEVKSPVWSSAYPLVAWHLFRHTGDIRVIEEHYEGIRAFVDYLTSLADKNILPPDGYGDHLSIAEGHRQSDPPMAAAAYYYVDTLLVVRMAAILEKHSESEKYRKVAADIRESFNRRFYDPARGEYGRGLQTEMILPLWAGLEPENTRRALFNILVKNILHENKGHLFVGILGAKHALDVFMAENRPDVAWAIIDREDYPGWGTMVRNRTSLSETWRQTGTNNHVMWGHVDAWFYRELGGIHSDPDETGFKHIIFQPFIPSGVKWVHAALSTLRGRVACGWNRQGTTISIAISVPANTTAELRLPAESLADGCITEKVAGRLVWDESFIPGAEGVQSAIETGSRVVLRIGSGAYQFECDWSGWPASSAQANHPQGTSPKK